MIMVNGNGKSSRSPDLCMAPRRSARPRHAALSRVKTEGRNAAAEEDAAVQLQVHRELQCHAVLQPHRHEALQQRRIPGPWPRAAAATSAERGLHPAGNRCGKGKHDAEEHEKKGVHLSVPHAPLFLSVQG
jgi:hypothetical protein